MLENRRLAGKLRPVSRLLVTGGSGFIGRHTLEELRANPLANCDVITWDRTTVGSILSETAFEEALKYQRPDAVLHLAWSPTQSDAYQSNPQNAEWAVATAHFARRCIEAGIWFLATGSAADDPLDQTHASPYSEAKRRLRREIESLQNGGRITWLRPQYVVSVADRRPRLIREFLEQTVDSGFALLNPTQRLDFIHVEDVASGITATLRNGLTGVVELGSGYLHSPEQVLEAVRSLQSDRLPAVRDGGLERSGLPPEALLRLGWVPSATHEFFGDFPTNVPQPSRESG